jgi:hypothetical protein
VLLVTSYDAVLLNGWDILNKLTIVCLIVKSSSQSVILIYILISS